MSTKDELEALYIPWKNHKLNYKQISEGVYYVGYFSGFGPILAKHRLWYWKKNATPASARGTQLFASQTYQEKALRAALDGLNNCVVISTTPTYFSQYLNACLLKREGFQLLEDRCYRHPGYPAKSAQATEHPGIPDKGQHWEHIWWKVLGQPTKIGLPKYAGAGINLNNCGVDTCNSLIHMAEHDRSERKNYLTVAWLPRETPWPKGWNGFFTAEDYKLGHNFDNITGLLGRKAPLCEHVFDLKIFENWEPDFEKWSPS